MPLSSSMPNLYCQDIEGCIGILVEYWVSLGYFQYFYTKLCSQMYSCGDLCRLGTTKLISEINL